MKQPPADFEADRFEQDPHAYASYLQTFDGRLRLDVAWSNLRDLLPARDGRHALDLGGGPGDLAIRLARERWRVTLVDGSRAMLALAGETARQSQVEDAITFRHGDAQALSEDLLADGFDLLLCHNVLEYVPDPGRVVNEMVRVVRPDGLVSILVRNRYGETAKSAISAGDLDAAERALEADHVTEPLYGERARLFDRPMLRRLLGAAGGSIVAEFGVRVLSDYLPASLTGGEDGYERVLAFEQTLSAIPALVDVARYVQVLAMRAKG